MDKTEDKAGAVAMIPGGGLSQRYAAWAEKKTNLQLDHQIRVIRNAIALGGATATLQHALEACMAEAELRHHAVKEATPRSLNDLIQGQTLTICVEASEDSCSAWSPDVPGVKATALISATPDKAVRILLAEIDRRLKEGTGDAPD